MMRKIQCPVKGCDHGTEPFENVLVAHLKHDHGMKKSETRLKYKIRVFGDGQKERKLRKQHGATQEERVRAKEAGIN